MTNFVQLSKFLALILRHNSSQFDLQLDENGFVDVQTVWQVILNRFGNRYTYEDLLNVVEGDQYGKKRYEIVNDKIRAMFGHSNVREINYPSVIPPQFLYHGTSQEAIPSIKQSGLRAQSRQYVHMTTNLDNAQRVANRHSQNIIILQIYALDAHKNNVVFHQPEQEHFLCKHIPPQYINFNVSDDSGD